jgi:ferritin
MENIPQIIISELKSEKIKMLRNINLNSIFTLTYNFDILKVLLENLVSNQQKLQNQINEMHKKDIERDKYTNTLLNDMNIIKETYIDKDTFNPILDEMKEVKDNLQKHDDKFNEGKIYIR